MQVYNGARLSDRLQHSLQAEGVPDGALLVMLRKRRQPDAPPPREAVRPSLAEVEAAVRAEAERQGRAVLPATTARTHAAHPFETRLEGIMRVRACACVPCGPAAARNAWAAPNTVAQAA